ncbi:MAG: hypothetical protein KJN68_05885 [Bacteroidia bacterium]|nr:hypothetical protein [Bacteroidia bacterium]
MSRESLLAAENIKANASSLFYEPFSKDHFSLFINHISLPLHEFFHTTRHMLKKVANIVFSTRLTAALFIAFAIAMGIGTFLDAGMETSPTPYSRHMIYNTWWFEAIMAFFVVNFSGNMIRFKLWRKEKWATLTLHLSFIFILLGAFVTRYIGYEGVIAIREGATQNKFLTQKTYITTYIDGQFMVNGQAQRLVRNDEVDFSPRLDNRFKAKTKYDTTKVTI